MPNYRRRFSKEEFKNELISHLRDIPPGLARAPKRLEAHAELKAAHYEAALKALDDAVEKLRNIAAKNTDPQTQQDAKLAIQRISEAVDTYGEASMSQNSIWDGDGP